eukprot:g2607.t1
MDDSGDTYTTTSFELESGQILPSVDVRYKSFGRLNEERDNCIFVCHALTGNQSVDEWWKEIFGTGKLLDPDRYMIVCANVLGSCYGTTGPTSVDPSTGKKYGSAFPDTTVRDSVRLHAKMVKEHLDVNAIACVVGGSMGGMQTLEWAAVCGPEYVKTIIPICCGTHHHAWQIGISETQRQAIYADPAWKNGTYLDDDDGKVDTRGPLQGIAVARQIAMFSYRSHDAYETKFGRRVIEDVSPGDSNGQDVVYDVERYLQYQGQKFLGRFDPLSYVKCTRMMDSHDIGRGRGGVAAACKHLITMPSLVVSVSSDALYPPIEQERLHALLPRSEYLCVESVNGHDGFLLDHEAISPVAQRFLSKHLPERLRPATS